jgi:histidine kinase/DNA gyrase B/HSP90-like ATPase
VPATLLVPPFASALIASMRGVGYSLETALADLVDNSISAAATRIDITWDWNDGSPLAMVADNGGGMSEERLVEAMRFGTAGPDEQRLESDLGRFGLGLKTASLSQCRRLTVASKTATGIAAFTWDIDRIREMGGDWHLISDAGEVPEAAAKALSGTSSGTAVVWQNIDFGRKEDRPDHGAFMADLERADRHLGMVFHRYVAGDARRVVITLNGRTIEPWDPFLETHEATLRMPEQSLASPGGRVRVRGFVLPHRDRFRTDAEFERAGGPAGWTTQQGFYVYRQKRLLAAGGWLGLGGSRTWTREEPSRLARVRIDIPNAADHEWRIDIRKAIARPPDTIRRPLQRLAEDVRTKAREVFVHRGRYGSRANTSEVARIWQINDGNGKRRYAIRRDHDLVALLRDRIKPADRELLEGLLDLIERTVPVDRVWLDVTEHGVPQAEDQTDEIVQAAISMAQALERAGVPFNDALARVARMDPFDRVEDLPGRAARLARKGSS